MVTRARDGTRKPSTKYMLDYALTAITTPVEPTSFTQAQRSPEWRDAMAAEFSALQQQGTWSLVPRSHQNVVGNKWVYKIKRRADGQIERYKARLCAKGFHQ